MRNKSSCAHLYYGFLHSIWVRWMCILWVLDQCWAVLGIISTPVWIQFTNYLCCPGSLRFKHQVNPIFCSLPSLPESSVFCGEEAQGLSIAPKISGFSSFLRKWVYPWPIVAAIVNGRCGCDKRERWQISMKPQRRLNAVFHAAVADGVVCGVFFAISSELRITIHLLVTQDNTGRSQN